MKNWVVANWKMHGSLDMVSDYVPALLDGLGEFPDWTANTRVILCPPSIFLCRMVDMLMGYPVRVGAQNVSDQPSGALTGEIAASMLADLDVRACLVGHSERRRVFGEDDTMVQAKLKAVLEAGLQGILCVGETLAQREAAEQEAVVGSQLSAALAGVDAEQATRLVVAYEPVWAIGTGVNATPQQAGTMHATIRGLLRERLGAAAGEAVPILYGGSVNSDNVATLMQQPDINGTLVGGASLKPETFLPIIKHSL